MGKTLKRARQKAIKAAAEALETPVPPKRAKTSKLSEGWCASAAAAPARRCAACDLCPVPTRAHGPRCKERASPAERRPPNHHPLQA